MLVLVWVSFTKPSILKERTTALFEVVVMILSSLMSLVISFLAVYMYANTTEEIVKVVTAGIALICLFLSFVFAPWSIVLLLVVSLVILKYPLLNY